MRRGERRDVRPLLGNRLGGPKSRQVTDLPYYRQNPAEAVSRAVSQFAKQHVSVGNERTDKVASDVSLRAEG